MRETLTYSDDTSTLQMLQATTIYIILRIFDTGEFSLGFDRQLVEVMNVRSHTV